MSPPVQAYVPPIELPDNVPLNELQATTPPGPVTDAVRLLPDTVPVTDPAPMRQVPVPFVHVYGPDTVDPDCDN